MAEETSVGEAVSCSSARRSSAWRVQELRRAAAGLATRSWRLCVAAKDRAKAASSTLHRWVRLRPRTAALTAAALTLLAPGCLVYHVYLDRSAPPDFDAFVRFELPGIGEVYDTKGHVLIELAHQYRRPVSYEEIPPVMREAILSAEDKSFFSHSGVAYGALPRVLAKTLGHTLAGWWKQRDRRIKPVFPQGGSTLTQQLVRGYFLRERVAHENGSTLYPDGWGPRLLSSLVGVPATNKLLRKLEEARLAFWLEDEMQRRFGSKERAKREIFARYASFIYLGHGRYGFSASSEYYFGKPLASFAPADAGKAALLAGAAKSPGRYAPVQGDPHALRRRNQVLALMAQNGYISEKVMKDSQAERVVTRTRNGVKTLAPAVVANVLEELKQYGDVRFAVDDLVEGRISIQSTVDERVQAIVNQTLEDVLAQYEKRHPRAKGAIQGSVVVLRNRDGGVLAEAGGRQLFKGRLARYSDLNRVTGSLRQPGSAFKPIVYFTAFAKGLALETTVPDEPIAVLLGNDRGLKWISNYDDSFEGPISMRKALAESRNAVAIWLARRVGIRNVIDVARELGIRTPLQPYIATALGASEVRLLELANVYRALASGIITNAHVIERVVDSSGKPVYQAVRATRAVRPHDALVLVQEGLRGVIRLPDGTAHSLDAAEFPIPVMGKTGTTSDFRDALFVGSTYGPAGITVAVRVGFDDNRSLGERETGGRAALPIFKEVMLRIYEHGQAGAVPKFPKAIEDRIDRYLAARAGREGETAPALAPAVLPAIAPAQSSSLPTPGAASRLPAPSVTEGTNEMLAEENPS